MVLAMDSLKTNNLYNWVIYQVIIGTEIYYLGERMEDDWSGRHYDDIQKTKIGVKGMPNVRVF